MPLDLDVSYTDGQRLADVCGVRSAELDELLAELGCDVHADDPTQRWWSGALDEKTALLVSDYAIASVTSVEKNLVEARLRLEDFLIDSCEESRRHLQAVGLELAFRQKPIVSPRDEIDGVRAEMNIVDFFRATAGVLDCLAGGIVFVAGLDTPIILADFRCLGMTPPNPRQVALLADMNAAVMSAGPPGWHAWADGMRNVTLHRARRLNILMYDQENPNAGVLDAYARPVTTLRPKRHLPCEPRSDDLTALAGGPLALALAEDAVATLRGVLDSTQAVVRAAAALLKSLWLERRADHSLIAQPLKQGLRKPGATGPTNFRGFAGAGPLHGTHVIAAPATVDRVVRSQKLR